MKPQIFAAGPTGDTPQHYLHRARMFRSEALQLVDQVNGEQNWPKIALLTHAIELSLKAFVRHSVLNGQPAKKEPRHHDLSGWYDLALQYGLQPESDMAAHIDALNELHMTHYTRYPQSRTRPVPSALNIADATADHLLSVFTQSINHR